MEPIDLRALVTQMETAASGVIRRDVTAAGGFSRQQLNDIAELARLIAIGIADGSLADAELDASLEALKESGRSFVNTLAGLTAVTIEETWNAIVRVLWDAIGKATGLALPVP
jgi:hypothetical protein